MAPSAPTTNTSTHPLVAWTAHGDHGLSGLSCQVVKFAARGESADEVFRAVLAAEGASAWKRELMYAAVVAGGWWTYRADQARGPRIFR